MSREVGESSGKGGLGSLLSGLVDNYGSGSTGLKFKTDLKDVAFDENRDGKADARLVFDKTGKASVRGRHADKVKLERGAGGRPIITYDSEGDGVSNYTIKDRKKKPDRVNGDGFSGVVKTVERDGRRRIDKERGNPITGRYAAPTSENLGGGLYPYEGEYGGRRDRGEANRGEKVARSQRRSVRDSVDRDQWINFGNSKGNKESFKISRVKGDAVPEGKRQYRIKDREGNDLVVTMDSDRKQRAESLAKLTDYFSQTPKHLRSSVKEVEFSRELKKHPLEEGTVPAEFDNGKIRIFPANKKDLDGLQNLNQALFNHEVGHGVDASWNRERVQFHPLQVRPSAYDTAAAFSPGVSKYGTNNLQEDFAEFYTAYFNARERGPQALAALKNAHPGRFHAMQEIFRGVFSQ